MTVESIVAELGARLPGWDIKPQILVSRLNEVCRDAEISTSAEELEQVTYWWYLAVFRFEDYDISLPRGLQKHPDEIDNPAGYLPSVLPDLIPRYREDSAAKVKELGLDDPADFDYAEWCEQNCIRADAA